MGSGRGDRNQLQTLAMKSSGTSLWLQWGPVVVTGISTHSRSSSSRSASRAELQWGPVVVTGISRSLSARSSSRIVKLQWGPVVVTGIRNTPGTTGGGRYQGFNGVRSW